MKRDLWKRSFFIEDRPVYPCPHCRHGILRRSHSNDIYETIPRYEQEWLASENGDIFSKKGLFHFTMDCGECGQIAHVLGDTCTDPPWDVGVKLRTRCIVKAIHPAPRMIDLPEDTPKAVTDLIDVACTLYWPDVASAANRLRASVEAIMDHFEIEGEVKNKDGEVMRLELASRIDKFKTKEKIDDEHKETLHALRYIGNIGSHKGSLAGNTLLDALELYEHALGEIFGQRGARMRSLRAKLRPRKS